MVDLRPDHLEIVKRILAERVPGYQVRAFGSRVCWTAQDTSDLDLVVMTDAPLSLARLADLQEAFSESDLPFRVDVLDWAAIGVEFKEIIEQDNAVIQQPGSTGSSGPIWRRLDMASKIVETVYGPISSDLAHSLLGDLCVPDGGVQTGPFGSLLHASDYVASGTPIITVEHLGNNRIIHENLPHVSDEDKDRLSKYILKTGDIVFSRVGSVDRRAIVHPEENGWLFSGRCLRVRPDPTKIDAGYLSWFLGLPGFKEYIRQIAVGATMPSLNTTILSNVPIYLPSTVQEQQAIACILGTLDDKVEMNRRINQTLERMARAIFKSWFVDFDPVRAKAAGRQSPGLAPHIADLFPDAFEVSELGEIPRGWRAIKLSDLCAVGRGSSPRPIRQYLEGTVPWIKIADATKANGPFLFETKQKLKEEGVSKSIFLKRGSLILSNSATCGLPIFLDIDGCIHDGWLHFQNLRQISQNYLYHVLIRLADHLVHIADGSVQKNLNTKLVGSQLILLPTRDILKRFDEITWRMFQKILENSRQSRTITQLRDTLLSKLISGELRVPDAERIVKRCI